MKLLFTREATFRRGASKNATPRKCDFSVIKITPGEDVKTRCFKAENCTCISTCECVLNFRVQNICNGYIVSLNAFTLACLFFFTYATSIFCLLKRCLKSHSSLISYDVMKITYVIKNFLI